MAKMESDALEQMNRQAAQLAKPKRSAPKLLAIHGVLPVLQAQLWVDGAVVWFEQGQTHPIAAHAKGLRLRAIKPPCVSFINRGNGIVCVCRRTINEVAHGERSALHLARHHR